MIYTKLLEIQKLGITLKKDGLNPHFKSSYVTLNEVLDKVKKPLNEAGIVIIQKVGSGLMGDHGLYTSLYDTEDATEVTSYVPFISATDMQKVGGAITYARRYALVALLGLEDNDDDGETASAPSKGKAKGVQDVEGVPFTI